MNYRKSHKNYDLFSALSKKQDLENPEVGILKLYKIIDWEGFRGLMEEITRCNSKDMKKVNIHLLIKDRIVPEGFNKRSYFEPYQAKTLCLDEGGIFSNILTSLVY